MSTPEVIGQNSLHAWWMTVAFVAQLITCAFGVVGSVVSLFCLRISKMHTGMVLQFGLFFSLFFVICFVVIPAAVVDEYYTLLGWQEKNNVVFVALHTTFGNLERNVFGLIATYRMVAVCFPLKFDLLSRTAVVLVLELCLCLGILALWLPVFVGPYAQDFATIDVGNASSYKMGFELYCITLFMPIVVTTSAYSIMIVFRMWKRRAATSGEGATARKSLDYVTFSVGTVIVCNFLLDVPHIILHFCRANSTDRSFVIVHVFYRLHFALDPLFFVVFNRHFREAVRQRVHCWLCCRAFRDARLSAAAANV
ncbi:uncharacterized protein LOC122261318 [Penaeus japonicus]|uniref:uncharacterized protein LOC122261318 n=1 Tax=Penaeus japonicus TaxID=27405 RepID=UPI001C713F94|nr:uncharacterized protein LOC122261318 [Penaeus japonicus]